ncbi:PIG-L deacetylase family protein [Bacillaceae bacterium C204]|uniref:PIG-L deacetylase family protein n=1 Tax=Neobacillus sp. 204 TaxID=3383351 RepID=UPI00397D6B8E
MIEDTYRNVPVYWPYLKQPCPCYLSYSIPLPKPSIDLSGPISTKVIPPFLSLQQVHIPTIWYNLSKTIYCLQAGKYVINTKPIDLLVFAPHPDDETLGTAGVIMRAVAAGKRVHVVIFTNGDGYPRAASQLLKKNINELRPEDYFELARVRQFEVYAAMAELGLKPSDITFLGYPDAGLDHVYKSQGLEPFQQHFTLMRQTYSMVYPDYHSLVYGMPAPYLKEFALSDTMDLIRCMQPKEIYVTDGADGHPDHQAAFLFVRDAVQATGYRGQVYTYLIHSGPDTEWPWPRGITPRLPFEAHEYKGERIPSFVPWPPPVRVPMSEAEAIRKLNAIRAYRSQLATDREYLESFIKKEEIFWCTI